MASVKMLCLVFAFPAVCMWIVNGLRFTDEIAEADSEHGKDQAEAHGEHGRLAPSGKNNATVSDAKISDATISDDAFVDNASSVRTPAPTPPNVIELEDPFEGTSLCEVKYGKEHSTRTSEQYEKIPSEAKCRALAKRSKPDERGFAVITILSPTPSPQVKGFCVHRDIGDELVWIKNIRQGDIASMGKLNEVCTRKCFPSAAKVYSKDRGLIRIDALRQGDLILSVDGTGKAFYDEASFYSLAEPERKGETFFAVTTKADRVLRISASHHLPTGSACCANLTTAMDLRIGDAVWIVGDSDREAVADKVKSIEMVVDDGLHSPVMLHGGHPIVDGVVTSFDDSRTIGMSARWMPYLSSICMAGNICGTMAKGIQLFECITKGECDGRKTIQTETASFIL